MNLDNLSCDGLCPSGLEQMQDEKGKIITDSLTAFYNIVDTTHFYYTLKSKAKQYEYGDANYMLFTKDGDKIVGASATNVSTHSSLNLVVNKHQFNAWVVYRSVGPTETTIFPLDSGSLSIDQHLFGKGIVKAKFDFTFENTLNSDKALSWKGLIYSEIASMFES